MTQPFQLLAETAAGGRRGRLSLPHQTVETPVFMPVGTQGTVKAVPQDTLESLDAQIILGNTYHLYLRPGHEAIRRMGGLHRFMSWPHGLLTDSGGFQVFSLNELRKVTDDGVRFRSHLDGSSHFFTPEHSIDVQIALGADVCMAFDECTEYPASRPRAEESLRLTMAWARRSLDHFRAHRHEVPWHEQEFLQEDAGAVSYTHLSEFARACPGPVCPGIAWPISACAMAAPAPSPVSYTHLDVYKRQPPCCAAVPRCAPRPRRGSRDAHPLSLIHI